MKNGSKSMLSFIIIVVLAVMAAFGSWSYLKGAKTTIYVFKGNYAAGTKLTTDMLVPMQVDASLPLTINSVAGDADGMYVTPERLQKVVNKTLRVDTFKGAPLMDTMTDEYGGSATERRISDNMVGVTIPVDNITAGTPFLESGARVNIYVGYSMANNQSVETLLFQNVKVLDVISSYRDGDTPDMSGVTVEVTPEQSVTLNHAAQFGKVRLGVVKTGGYKETAVKPATMGDVSAPQTVVTPPVTTPPTTR